MKFRKINFLKAAKLLALPVLAAAILFSGCKKEGCTDPTAVNYDPDAKNDDGSCAYDDSTNAAQALASYFETAGNQVTDPGFGQTDITPANNLGNRSTPGGGFLQEVSYKGAVDPNAGTPWYAEDGGTGTPWTYYSRLVAGQTTDHARTVPGATKTVTDAWMQGAGNNVTFDSDTVYLLQGPVFINDGQTLTILPGTIIKGKPGQTTNAAALIVARGGQLIANGTAAQPIIFTFEADQLNGGTDVTTSRGNWGGLILLGKAPLNSAPGETSIEGIPTSESRGKYGGSNAADNSGSLKYISIRHGGTDIGEGNEINGLTLGGVGNGTTIEHVEVIGNKDDGIEWFGGTVRARRLISAYCADDALDYDEGYDGENQFVIVHQDPGADAADRGGEHDGGTSPETGEPYATPLFYNVTAIGNSASRTITFRDNAGGEYHNSIFVNYGKGIDIELKPAEVQDSYKQYQDGNLKIANNIFYNIGSGEKDTGAELLTVSIED